MENGVFERVPQAETLRKSPRPQSSYLEGHCHQLLELGTPLREIQELCNVIQAISFLTEGSWGNPVADVLTCVQAANYA